MAVSHIKSNTIADWTGTVTIGNSAGSSTTMAATDLVRPGDWNSAHNQFYTLSGNTTNQSTASGTDVVFSAAGPSLTLGGSTGSIVFSTPPHVSSFKLPIDGGLQTTSVSGPTSHAQAFNLPEPGSFSFIRIPAVMTLASTSFATTAATLSATANVSSTWNAVVYSIGTGASSRSLQSVASGSGSWVWQNGINVAVNGTQYSQTQLFTYWAEGNSSTTSVTTARSTSTLNWSTGIHSNLSGNRFIDIPFANSLSAGPYWLVFGNSTSSSANSTGISGATTIAPRYTQHFALTQINSAFGVMNGADLTGGGQINCGVFSTAGGGTTASIPLANISTTASQPAFPFFLLRSA